MHRRRGWRDTPTLIQYEPDAPPGDSLIPFYSLKAWLRGFCVAAGTASLLDGAKHSADVGQMVLSSLCCNL